MLSLVAGSILLPELIIRSTVSITTNLITSVNYLISISKSDSELQNMLINNDIKRCVVHSMLDYSIISIKKLNIVKFGKCLIIILY